MGPGKFAVFVDRAPIKPRQSLRAVASGDLVCEHTPGCPDEAYLADRRVFTTTRPELTVQRLPPIAGNRERTQIHTITVVLLDATGHRIGESAWELDVRVRRIGV